MSTPIDDLDRCIEALTAVRLALKTHATSPDGVARVDQIAQDLACYRSAGGMYGGIAQQVADAIQRGILNREPPPPPPAA